MGRSEVVGDQLGPGPRKEIEAAADLLDLPLCDFTPGPYVTCLDLGSAGGVFTRGWDRRVMASGTDGKEIKKRINQAIHPPVDDAAKILAAADRVYIELPFFPRDEETFPRDEETTFPAA